ncbi:hypothetical protein ACHHYP_04710 [Achlya hypogyna]|uniref:Cytochrome P450 n=1 Tax=Achlya hypogyna TaxID=1202772 RepID=A0A1V9Z0U2_ACHHY|nr:hypothetical protein ACHHYP_04710 [Achlya hypogyna]
MEPSTSWELAPGAAIALSLPLAYVGYRFLKRPHPLDILPGPPSKSVIYGNAREFGRTRWSDATPFPEPFSTWMRDYGLAFHYRVLFYHRVALADPVSLKHVLVTNAVNYPRSDVSRALLRNLTGGDGLLSSEDPTHAAQRKRLNPHFAHTVFKSYIPVFGQEVSRLAAELDAVVTSKTPVHLPDLTTRLTLNIIGKTAFGYDFDAFDAQRAKSVIDAFEQLNTPPRLLYTLGLIFIPGFRHWPLPYLEQIQRAKATLYKIVDDVVAHKLKAPTAAADLLDLMLDGITPDEARVHVMTFMFAGHETTSNSLCWVLGVLTRHPEVEQRVVRECRQMLTRHDGMVTWDALAELPYLTAVIHETLRLYPTALFITARNCERDDYIPRTNAPPFLMPKGAHVSVSVGAIHRNPLYWTDPDMFCPDRFIEGSREHEADKALRDGKGNTFVFMPFSAGTKNCIGKRFAIAEMQTALALLLPKYAFKLTPDAVLHPKMTGVTIKPSNLCMTVEARPTEP